MNALARCFLRLPATALLALLELSTQGASLTVSPAAVSNTYSGTITLQVTGLSAGSSVVVQKYLDINANGVVDANDLLVQQFSLTDGQPGMVIGGVTNINVPGDTDGAANGQITATLNFPSGDPSQKIIGKYLFALSSPAGQSTSALTITNFPYAQKITGTVVSHGTNVPNAVVILFPPPRSADSGPGNPVALAVANNTGSYTIQAPAGSYVPLASKNDYVASFAASPMLALGSGQTITTNLVLTNATASISGKLVDLNSGAGIPGIFIGNGSSSGFLATYSTDGNGSFTERVTADYWSLDGAPSGLMLHGYVGYNGSTNINTTGGSVSGLVFPFPKATALFYGTIKDANNLPLAGIDVYASDNNGEYSADGYSDANGNYAVGVLGGLSDDSWQVGVDTGTGNPVNYIFSQPAFVQNGGTNLNASQAVRADFTALLATNQISGNVKFNGTNLVGVGVYAYATINGTDYNVYTDTDANGNYSFNVGNGNWSVGVNANGGNDSLDAIIGAGNYAFPQNQTVTIANNNGTANFNIQSCSGVQIITTSLPDGQVGSFYNQWLQASSCSGNINWSLNDPQDFPPGLNLNSSGEIDGTPASAGTYHFSVHVDDGNGHSANQNLSLTVASVSQPLQLTTTWLPQGTNTEFYSQTLQAFGGQPPYTWSLAPYSGALPPTLSLSSGGVLSGTLATNGAFYFFVRVTDAAQDYVDSSPALYLYIVNPSLPLQITTTSLSSATVGIGYTNQFTVTGGQPPYQWSLALGSANLPANLTLAADGALSGVPAVAGDFPFIVQVVDSLQTAATAPLSLHVTASAAPTLAVASMPVNGQLQLRIGGNPGQTYALQYSLDLSRWQQLLTTNAPAGTFTVTDTAATNAFRFYRVVTGP